MKFATTFAILATAAATVSAQELLTNGERLARGLPPRAPVRRWSSTAGNIRWPRKLTGVAHILLLAARRSTPSNAPSNQCNTGPVQCCVFFARRIFLFTERRYRQLYAKG